MLRKKPNKKRKLKKSQKKKPNRKKLKKLLRLKLRRLRKRRLRPRLKLSNSKHKRRKTTILQSISLILVVNITAQVVEH